MNGLIPLGYGLQFLPPEPNNSKKPATSASTGPLKAMSAGYIKDTSYVGMSYTVSSERIHTYDPGKENICITPERTREILKNVKQTSSQLKSAPDTVHFYEFSKYRILSQQLNHQINEPEYRKIVDFVNAHAAEKFAEVIKSKHSLVVSLDENHQLIFKSSGKVYLKLGEIGKGDYNKTTKSVLIASAVTEHLSKDKLVTRAFRAPKPRLTTSALESRQSKWESKFNVFLKSASKEYDLSHVNIIKSVSSIGGDLMGSMSEVYEGNVNTLLAEKKLTEQEANDIAFQMATGIAQLHKIGVRHRDIKPDNFLFLHDDHGKLKVVVTDFGTSTGPGELRNVHHSFFGLIKDPFWDVAGRVSSPVFFSSNSDVYQLGTDLLMVLTSTTIDEFEKSFQDDAKGGILKHLGSGATPEKVEAELKTFMKTYLTNWKGNPESWSLLNKITDPETKAFLLRMLTPKAINDRPSMDEVVAFFERKKTQEAPET